MSEKLRSFARQFNDDKKDISINDIVEKLIPEHDEEGKETLKMVLKNIRNSTWDYKEDDDGNPSEFNVAFEDEDSFT